MNILNHMDTDVKAHVLKDTTHVRLPPPLFHIKDHSSLSTLSSFHIDHLNTIGYTTIDHFQGDTFLNELHQEIEDLFSMGGFHLAGLSQGETHWYGLLSTHSLEGLMRKLEVIIYCGSTIFMMQSGHTISIPPY
eukprot:TRINITY_DN3153_c0_g1_i2.p1 TRINITY_DN3153_c0_g1~~TRINITY_DN3153_c0_g1_i2.p1  ORF type:complete len:134 (-),score=19.69 TRINITY_DN3153_c0_g1_i2:386-787(-)